MHIIIASSSFTHYCSSNCLLWLSFEMHIICILSSSLCISLLSTLLSLHSFFYSSLIHHWSTIYPLIIHYWSTIDPPSWILDTACVLVPAPPTCGLACPPSLGLIHCFNIKSLLLTVSILCIDTSKSFVDTSKSFVLIHQNPLCWYWPHFWLIWSTLLTLSFLGYVLAPLATLYGSCLGPVHALRKLPVLSWLNSCLAGLHWLWLVYWP